MFSVLHHNTRYTTDSATAGIGSSVTSLLSTLVVRITFESSTYQVSPILVSLSVSCRQYCDVLMIYYIN